MFTELSHTWESPWLRRTGSGRGTAMGQACLRKTVPLHLQAWPQSLAVSCKTPRFFHIQKRLRNFVFPPHLFFFFSPSFFVPGQMSAPDRKHDWIEYKMLALSVPRSRAPCLCPHARSSGGRGAVGRPWAACGEATGRGHTATGHQRRSMGVPGPLTAVPVGACATERVRSDLWGGDTRRARAEDRDRDRLPRAPSPARSPLSPRLSPRAAAERQERGPAGGQGRGLRSPWAGGKGQENRDEATASSFSLPLILLHSPCSLSLPLPFPLPPSF